MFVFADRYLAISRPLLYVPVRTPRLVFCWILAVNILSGNYPPSHHPATTKLNQVTFLYFPVLVSAPVFFAWSDSRHHAQIFNGSAQVSLLDFI